MKNSVLITLQCCTLWSLILFSGVETANSGASKAIEAISKGLESPNWRDRERAVLKLEKISPVTAQVEETLRKALQDPSYYVRSKAVGVIKRLGPVVKALIPDLLTRLKDPQEKYSLKSGLPSFLIQLSDGSPEVIGALLKLAKNEKEELLIRWTSLRSLEDIERSGEVLKQDLLHLALNDLSPVIQSQAWLTLARLQLHDDDILPALVKMGQGHYGHRHLINAGVVHTAFSPLSKALHTLMSMGQWKRTIPLFLDALDRIEDLIVLDSRRFAQYLVEHPDEAKPYVPRLLKIVARSPTNFQQVLARYSLLGALSRIVPRSPELREILEDLIKNPDDSGVKGVEKILRCIDPHAPLSVNGKYPCTGSWEMPSRKKIERKLKN